MPEHKPAAPKGAKQGKERPVPVRFSDWASI